MGYVEIYEPLAPRDTLAYRINNAGEIVGTYVDFESSAGGGRPREAHGFIYSGGTYTKLPDPAGASGNTQANGINDAGQIVGAYTDSSGISHGFLYNPGSYTT